MLYFYEIVDNKKVLQKLELTNLDKLSAINHQAWLKKEIRNNGSEPVSAILALV